jgi:hypothetical protein
MDICYVMTSSKTLQSFKLVVQDKELYFYDILTSKEEPKLIILLQNI